MVGNCIQCSYIRHVLITGMECSYIRRKFNGIEYKCSVNRVRDLITGVLITSIYCIALLIPNFRQSDPDMILRKI